MVYGTAMSLAAKLLATALALPVPWYPPESAPETHDERRQRIEMIVAAHVTELATAPAGWGWAPSELAWASMVVTWHESGRWRLDVHDGRKRGDNGQSVCLGQIHGGDPELAGTSLQATRRCVREVYEHLARHWERCLSHGPSPSAWAMGVVYAGYGTGHSCNPQHRSPYLGRGWALKRGKMWWRLRS